MELANFTYHSWCLMSNFHLLKNHIQRIILQTFLIQPQPSDKQTRKCEMCIILKQIKIFKSPTMTEWIKRAPLWRYDRGQNTQLINRKKDVLSKELSILCLPEGWLSLHLQTLATAAPQASLFSSELVSLYSQLLGNHRVVMIAILKKGVGRCWQHPVSLF